MRWARAIILRRFVLLLRLQPAQPRPAGVEYQGLLRGDFLRVSLAKRGLNKMKEITAKVRRLETSPMKTSRLGTVTCLLRNVSAARKWKINKHSSHFGPAFNAKERIFALCTPGLNIHAAPKPETRSAKLYLNRLKRNEMNAREKRCAFRDGRQGDARKHENPNEYARDEESEKARARFWKITSFVRIVRAQHFCISPRCAGKERPRDGRKPWRRRGWCERTEKTRTGRSAIF